MSASRPAFRWLRPDVVPVLVACGAGVTLATWASVRNFRTNPDVYINRARRHEDLDSPKLVQQAENYGHSFLRKLGVSHGEPHIFNNTYPEYQTQK
eukprot:jgi/Astpho2/9972/Aster-06785